MRLPNPFDDRPSQIGGKITTLYALLITANVAAWGWAWVMFNHSSVLLGTAFLAYTFGLRHAVDTDHIAAIDNVVRRLMQQERAPYSVGFFFSLGHSTVVILVCVAIAASAAIVQSRFDVVHSVGSVIGTGVSALFLIAIAIANLFVVKGVWAVFVRVRRGERAGEEELNALLAGRGFYARLFQPLFRAVSRSWLMYPIGFLFGLGFDTATEIGLLGISASQAAQGLSFWATLVFPALFTAGMSLMDTSDSVVMTRAYGWAFVNPIRKLWYNLTITVTSVVVALFIGGIEALALVGDKLSLEGRFWQAVGSLNDNLTSFGFSVVVIFIASWAVSTLVYRWQGYANTTGAGPGQP